MTKRVERSDDQSLKGPADGKGPNHVLRELTDEEIQSLEDAIDNPIERKYLVHWVSLSIRGVVRSSTLPSSRQLRDDFIRMGREGRQWIRNVSAYPDIFTPRERAERDSLIKAAKAFCDSIDFRVAQAASSIKAGQPKTSPALEIFIDNMIGVAKKAKILPSTPQRGNAVKKSRTAKGHIIKSAAEGPLPPFYRFVLEVVSISIEIISTSSLSGPQKSAAISVLPKTEKALIKAIVKKRGRVRAYKEGATGLTEW